MYSAQTNACLCCCDVIGSAVMTEGHENEMAVGRVYGVFCSTGECVCVCAHAHVCGHARTSLWRAQSLFLR